MQPITIQQTERGIAFGVGPTVFHSTNDMPGMGGEQLRSTLITLADRDAPLHEEMIPERIPGKRRELFAGTVMPVAGGAIDAARRAKSETLAADAVQRTPVLSVDPVLAVETRKAVRAMDPRSRHDWVESADLAGLTVTAAEGNPANMEPAIFERARERFWIENWIARNNNEGRHPAQPSIDLVLATGPNMAAVRSEAKRYYREHAERMASVDAMEAEAKSLVAFLAVLIDVSAEDALAMAMGRDREAA